MQVDCLLNIKPILLHICQSDGSRRGRHQPRGFALSTIPGVTCWAQGLARGALQLGGSSWIPALGTLLDPWSTQMAQPGIKAPGPGILPLELCPLEPGPSWWPGWLWTPSGIWPPPGSQSCLSCRVLPTRFPKCCMCAWGRG